MGHESILEQGIRKDLRVEEDTGEKEGEYKEDLTIFSQHAAQKNLLEAMVDLWWCDCGIYPESDKTHQGIFPMLAGHEQT